MTVWSQRDVRKHMHVFASDEQDLGQIAEVYEDSFLIQQGVIFHHHRYIPYSAIATIEGDRLQLTMSADEVKEQEWAKRPDYKHHLSDPTQLMYDQGHGLHDPFEETNPDK